MGTHWAVSAQAQGLTTSTLSTLRVIEVLAFGSMRTSEVAHHVRVHPRTARRALVQLEERGWVNKIPGPWPEWELTGRVLALASRAAHGTLRGQAAIDLVDDLCEATGLPVYAVIPCYDAVCCLADSRYDVMLERGDVAPAIENVGGHALMAYRPQWCEQNLAIAGTTAAAWDSRLNTIRSIGYAEDHPRGRIELAFPLPWRDDPAVAALVVGDVPKSDLDRTVKRVFAVVDQANRHAPSAAHQAVVA